MDNKKGKTQHMFALVEQWKSSSQTRKAFCQQHDLKLSTFGYWIARKDVRKSLPEDFYLPM